MKEVKEKFLVKSLSKNMSQELFLDSGVSWLGSILNELQEDLEDGEMGAASESEAGIWFKGELIRRSNGKFGEVLFLEGELSANYYTNCIRTGRLMIDSFETEVKAVYIDEEVITRYKLEEEVTVELENEEFELYPYKDDTADLKKVLHEYTFLNRNPYPTLEGETEAP